MCAKTIDRRTSIPGTSCRNCGLDVGQHPDAHKCQQPRNLYFSPLPPLPPLSPTKGLSDTKQPLQIYRKPIQSPNSSLNSGSYSHLISTPSSSPSSFSPTFSDTSTASPSPIREKWSRFSPKNNNERQSYASGDGSSYLDNFTANLPEQDKRTKHLVDKVRHTQKWQQWTRQGDIQKHSGKLWGKLRMTVQNMADKIPSQDDKGPESDESDWEGETHVTRILREYYVKKRRPLPCWLHDGQGTTINHHHRQPQHRTEPTASNMLSSSSPNTRQRLWDLNQQPVTPERPTRVRQSYPSNISDTFNHYNEPKTSKQRHLSGREANIVQHKYTNSNYQRQDQLRASYQINPPSSHDMNQERRFSKDHTQQRQHWTDNDDNARSPTSFYHDRLHGPRLRPNKHNHR